MFIFLIRDEKRDETVRYGPCNVVLNQIVNALNL